MKNFYADSFLENLLDTTVFNSVIRSLWRYASVLILMGAAGAAQAKVLEEILVTAQKRSQSLQDVPITLNAFNAGFIQTAGVQDLSGLQQFTPGLDIDGLSVTRPTYRIRGIGSTSLSIGTDPVVGIYTDGIYVGRSASATVEFSDIERVEVLKGPQGTLFGRNAAAGAIQVITRKPVQEQEGYVRFRLGNYDKKLGEAVVNTPLIEDTLAARFNLTGSHRDGYIDNALGGRDLADEKFYAGRASMLWTPGDDTSIRYSFDYNWLDQDANPAIGLNPDLTPTGTRGGQVGDVDVFGPVANDVLVSEESREQYAHSLEWEQQFETVAMNFIASYRSFDSSAREDDDGLGLLEQTPAEYFAYLDTHNREDNQQFYSELRFSGVVESISWVAGLSFYDEHGKQSMEVTSNVGTLIRNLTSDPVAGFFTQPDEATCLGLSALALGEAFSCSTFDSETMINDAETQSLAVFGDFTWQINDYFSVTAGARFSYDEKKFGWFNPPNSLTGDASGDVIFAANVSPEATLAKEGWVRTQGSWNNFDPRLVFSFYPEEGVMLWASYANGYTAGGYNSLQPGAEFDPEEVDNFELGIKSEMLDSKLRLNASVYHYIYSDKQDIAQIDNGGTVRVLSTVTGDAKGTGFEADMVWLPMANLQLGLNYGYLDSEWKDREIEGYYDGCGSPRRAGNLKGEPLEGQEERLALMLDYDLQLGDAGTVMFHIDHNFTSDREISSASADYCTDFETKDDDLHLTNARITWADSTQTWQAALWAENLFDTDYVVIYSGLTETLGTPYVRRNYPLMYGVELIYNW